MTDANIVVHSLAREDGFIMIVCYLGENGVHARIRSTMVNESCGHVQHTQHIEPMLKLCSPIICDAGPALNQHSLNISCLLDMKFTVIALMFLTQILSANTRHQTIVAPMLAQRLRL